MTDQERLCFDLLMASADAHKRGALAIWTVYDRSPDNQTGDYPDGCIARLYEVIGGETKATEMTLKGDLEEIRATLWRAGLMKLSRDAKDEPQIVESWV